MSAAARSEPQGITPTAFQQLVLATPEDHDLFLGGGRGGGKSYALGLLVLRAAEQYRERARVLYTRLTHAGCEDFIALTRSMFGLVYGPAARFNANEGLWKLPTGATLEINQLADPGDFAKYQGRSFTHVLVDEAGQYPDPSLLDLLRSCLRAPLPLTPRFILSANPGGSGHQWIAARHVFRSSAWQPYVEPKTGRRFINAPSTYRDNDNLDRAEYARQLAAACATDPDLLKAWDQGDWGISRGRSSRVCWMRPVTPSLRGRACRRLMGVTVGRLTSATISAVRHRL
jgi:hypothetical protein